MIVMGEKAPSNTINVDQGWFYPFHLHPCLCFRFPKVLLWQCLNVLHASYAQISDIFEVAGRHYLLQAPSTKYHATLKLSVPAIYPSAFGAQALKVLRTILLPHLHFLGLHRGLGNLDPLYQNLSHTKFHLYGMGLLKHEKYDVGLEKRYSRWRHLQRHLHMIEVYLLLLVKGL